jgi:hypothetical protein
VPETISLLGAVCSLILPWILGAVWVFWLLRLSGRWNAFLVAGYGYLVGIFLTTLLIRLWHFLGLPLHYWSMAATLAVVSLLGILALRLQVTPTRSQAPSAPLEKWQIALTALFLILIVFRYTTVAQEMYLRPLFPWDAWMNWAPKAIAWFHHNDIVPWVSRNDWLDAPASALNYTAGATKAWLYPELIPLVQLWGMLGSGVSDHTIIYLPWLGAAAALGLVLYGQLRQSGANILVATMAAYVLLNLPFVNVYVALPGYADLWVASIFGCSALALHEWGASRRWPYALLALLLAIMCTQAKIPGLILGGIVLVVYLTSIIAPGKKLVIGFLVALTICLATIATIGMDFSIPNIGRVAISTEGIVLPYIGYYELSYHPVHDAMINTLFLMLNWNMLWYLVVLMALATIVERQLFNPHSLELRVLILTLIFIFFVYYFTNRYKFALDYTQVNRALFYTIPIFVFYLFQSSDQWRRSRRRNANDMPATPA